MLVAQEATNGRWCGPSRGARGGCREAPSRFRIVRDRRRPADRIALGAPLALGGLRHVEAVCLDRARSPRSTGSTLTSASSSTRRRRTARREPGNSRAIRRSWFKHVGLGRADFAKFIGQTVTVGGVRARDGSHYGYMRKFTFPDGNSIELEARRRGGQAMTTPHHLCRWRRES